VSYDSFEAADAAIEAMNGQFLCNRPISVTFAYKKDTKGERHGTPAERMLAANLDRKATAHRPHTMFAAGPASRPGQGQGQGQQQQGLPQGPGPMGPGPGGLPGPPGPPMYSMPPPPPGGMAFPPPPMMVGIVSTLELVK
jgi:splicing factor 3B subunit 4